MKLYGKATREELNKYGDKGEHFFPSTSIKLYKQTPNSQHLKVRLEFYLWEEEIGHYSRLLIELNKFTKFGSAGGVLVLN